MKDDGMNGFDSSFVFEKWSCVIVMVFLIILYKYTGCV